MTDINKLFVSSMPLVIRWVRSSGLVSWGMFLGYFIASLIGINVVSIPDSSHLENARATIGNWFSMTLIVMSYELVGRWFVRQYQILMIAVNSSDLFTFLTEGIIFALVGHMALILVAGVWYNSPDMMWAIPLPMLIILALIMVVRYLALAILDIVFEEKSNPSHHD